MVKKYRAGPARVTRWDSLRAPDADHLLSHSSLAVPPSSALPSLLRRVAVCKLNGGLGTSMGCRDPKSALIVRDGQSFLDLTVEQLLHLQDRHGVRIPLLLMNSFYYTHEKSQRLLRDYRNRLDIRSFQQNRYPRFREGAETFLSEKEFGRDAWYPPGHGDFYTCFQDHGLLDQLIQEGREILFIANADNLGAVIDPALLSFMIREELPFLMEMTPKTPADVKGGTLYQENGKLKLLEI
ncbi:MAG: hypothetical protein GWM98_10115, partial [Nitrospinaceae bacterium]|nr:hypothetical protein [Nitrospinaceae bacterium]